MAYSSSEIVASTTTLLTCLVFFVTLRFITRYKSRPSASTQQPLAQPGTSGGIGADDWVCLFAGVGSMVGCLLILVSANDGLGRPALLSTPATVRAVLLLIWLDQINYLLVMALTKTSTLLLYTRIFHAQTSEQRRFRKYCWILIGIVCLTSFFLIIFAIIMCDPVPYFWNRAIVESVAQGGSCRNHRPYLYANTIISIVTDCLVVALPVKLIWGLQMRKKKKLTVLGVFGLGGIVIICSIMRATEVGDAAHRNDPMTDIAGLCLWSLVESVISVICCCVPGTYRPIKDFFVESFDFRENTGPAGKETSAPVNRNEMRSEDLESASGESVQIEENAYGKTPAIDPRW